MSESEVIQIVESILPSVEETQNIQHLVVPKCEQMYQTFNGNGFIRPRQHGSLIITPIPEVKSEQSGCLPYNQAGETGKQYSSTTIVGGGNHVQNEMEVTTLHVLGLDGTNGDMEVAYDNSFQVPMEVPMDTMVMENQEMQSVGVGDRTTVINPSSGRIQQNQPMLVTSTNYGGNCFIAVQENQVNSATVYKKQPVSRATQRPRPTFVRHSRNRMVVDQHTSIPVVDFKAQLIDSSDTIGTLSLAPRTKKMMKYLNLKKRLFSLSGRKIWSSHHLHLFTRHLTTRTTPEKPFDDMVLKPLGYQPEVDPTKIKRITRRRRYPEAEEYQRKLFQEQMQQTFNNLVTESQKSMEAVFLENSGRTMEEEDQGNLQILVQAAENDSLENEGRVSNTGMKTASNGEIHLIVPENSEEHVSENLATGDWLETVQQYIIIVPSDPIEDSITETVISS